MENLTFEQAMNRLNEIVDALESNNIEMEESLKLYEEGLNLAKFLQSQLKSYEEKANELLKEFEEND